MPDNQPRQPQGEQKLLWDEVSLSVTPASDPGESQEKPQKPEEPNTPESEADTHPLTPKPPHVPEAKAIPLPGEQPLQAVQARFEFTRPPVLPVLSVAEQASLTQALVKRYNLHGLRLDKFLARPAQVAAIERIFADRKPDLLPFGPPPPVLVEADTGLGKTIILLAVALEAKSRGLRTVHVGAQRKLGDQAKLMTDEFIDSGVMSAEVINGRTAPATREKKYNKKPELILTTRHTLENDFSTRFNWEQVGVVVFDETQLMQDRQAEIPVVKQVLQLFPQIRVIALSATLSRSDSDKKVAHSKLRTLQACFGSEARRVKVHMGYADDQKPEASQKAETEKAKPKPTAPMKAPKEGTTSPPITRSAIKPLTEPAVDEIYTLPLPPRLSKLCIAIRNQASRCLETVRQDLDTDRLFLERSELPLWVPPFEARAKLARLTEDPGHKTFIAEAHLWCDLFGRFATLGRQPGLERFAYVFAKTHFSDIDGELYLPEIEGQVAKAERGKVSRAHQRVVAKEGTTDVFPLVKELAKGTMYEVLFSSSSWVEVWEKCQPFFQELKHAGNVSSSGKRRGHKLVKLNSKLDPEDRVTNRARWFFEAALRHTARLDRSDHPKVAAVLELIDEDFEMIRSSPSFLFSTNGRHAEFLTEVIHRHFGRSLHVGAVHGQMWDTEKRDVLKGFKAGEVNLMASTIDFAGTGLDAKNPRWALIFGLSKGEASIIQQARGRVVNRALQPFHLYGLATRGTMESKWYDLVPKRLAERQQVASDGAENIFPAFEVE